MAQISIFSENWFEMIKQANSKIGELNMTPAMRDICLNIVVTPAQDVDEAVEQGGGQVAQNSEQLAEENHELYLASGSLHKGQQADARTTMTVDYATMKELLVNVDMNKATQAFINGDIQVTGDMSQLMAVQMTKVSDEQKLLFKTILENTKV